MEVALDEIVATAVHDDQFGGLCENGLAMPEGEEDRVKDDLSRQMLKEHLDFEFQDTRLVHLAISLNQGVKR